MVKFKLLTLVLFLIVLQSCTKNSADPIKDNVEDPIGYIPREGKVYHYKLNNGPSQLGTVITRVTKSKDTLDTRIVDILSTTTSTLGVVTRDSIRAYSSKGFTYNIMVGHPLYKKYKGYSGVLEITLHGYPQIMVLDNRGTVNNIALQFRLGSIQLYTKEVGDEGFYDVWETTEYHTGGVVAVEEIETPAGKFKCSKWIYESKDIKKTYYSDGDYFIETSIKNREIMWLSHGVGVVKSMVRFISRES